MADIHIFNGITGHDLDPDRVLENLPELQSVIVLGYDGDGDEYFASSIADGGDVLWLLERLKKQLLEVPDDQR